MSGDPSWFLPVRVGLWLMERSSLVTQGTPGKPWFQVKLLRKKKRVKTVKMNPPLLEGIFLNVERKYHCHNVPGILCTALVNPAQQRWAQIGVGAEKGWSGGWRSCWEETLWSCLCSIQNEDCEKILSKYFSGGKKTHLNLKQKNKTKPPTL